MNHIVCPHISLNVQEGFLAFKLKGSCPTHGCSLRAAS
jgi:hypothetical protein